MVRWRSDIGDLNWSQTEKRIARKAFDLALSREFDAVIQEVRCRAAAIEAPSALWDPEDFLTKSRKDIDQRYDYRYSDLIEVFASLIWSGRLTEAELNGLGEDKLGAVRTIVSAAEAWSRR